MITKLPGSGNYNTFAYSVELLKEFVRTDEDGGSRSMNPAHQRRSFRSGGSFRASFRGASLFARKDTSIRSVGSFRGRNRSFSSGKNKRSGVNTSIQEPGNLWKEWKAQSAAVFGTKNNTSQ